MKIVQKHQRNKTTPLISTIALVLALFVPIFGVASVAKLDDIAVKGGIIAICNGFNIIFIRINNSGIAQAVDIEDLAVIAVELTHCGDCLLVDDVAQFGFFGGLNASNILNLYLSKPYTGMNFHLAFALLSARAPPAIYTIRHTEFLCHKKVV